MKTHEIMKKSDLPANSMKHVKVDGNKICVVNSSGKIYALSDKCGHMGYSLAKGTIEGKELECKLHHAKFDITTGQNTRKPQLKGVTKLLGVVETKDIPTYNVSEEEGTIYIDL